MLGCVSVYGICAIVTVTLFMQALKRDVIRILISMTNMKPPITHIKPLTVDVSNPTLAVIALFLGAVEGKLSLSPV